MWPGVEPLLLLGLFTLSQLYFNMVYEDIVPTTPGDSTGRDGSITGTNGSIPVVCYFSFDRMWPDNDTVHPALNATLCTHLIFIPTMTVDCQIALRLPSDATKYLDKIPLLRKQNPKLKVLVSHGGGGSIGFSPILFSAGNREKYVKSIIPFLKKYDLDGIDIDWEFPGWGNLPRQQRQNFTIVLQQLRDTFDNEARTGKKYYLTAAVAAGRSVMQIYDVKAMAKSLDWINLMCYDYHSYSEFDPVTDYNSPLYPNDWWKKIVITSGNIGWSAYEWHKRGMPKEKIVVGLPTYTHTYTLLRPDNYHGHLAPAKGPGRSCNECGYAWVCNFTRSAATVVFDEDAYVPYAYKEDQWVSFDNVKSLTRKTEWVLNQGFAGIMVFSMNNDDYSNFCGMGKFPLISAMVQVINSKTTIPNEDIPVVRSISNV